MKSRKFLVLPLLLMLLLTACSSETVSIKEHNAVVEERDALKKNIEDSKNKARTTIWLPVITSFFSCVAAVAAAFLAARLSYHYHLKQVDKAAERAILTERLHNLYTPAIQLFLKDGNKVTSATRIESAFRDLTCFLIENVRYAEPDTQMSISCLYGDFLTIDSSRRVVDGFSSLPESSQASDLEINAHERNKEILSKQLRILHLDFVSTMNCIFDEYAALCSQCGFPDATKLATMYKELNSHFMVKSNDDNSGQRAENN